MDKHNRNAQRSVQRSGGSSSYNQQEPTESKFNTKRQSPSSRRHDDVSPEESNHMISGRAINPEDDATTQAIQSKVSSPKGTSRA